MTVTVVVVTKGLEIEVVRILSLYTVIDLSSNRFEGQIPSIVGDLIAVRVLNLSHCKVVYHHHLEVYRYWNHWTFRLTRFPERYHDNLLLLCLLNS
ncbi:hypothetical protein T459_15805 [Capsicum annuum]|uniref:Uncharacterized protein n=1 Tax=Capsicum annuum TaxID=4072 RepID=A0A2G2Z6Y0_CAPAN|nr:hypothetical protein T459_15805 [Capsicum annuum]